VKLDPFVVVFALVFLGFAWRGCETVVGETSSAYVEAP
jgi:hypothetical protein